MDKSVLEIKDFGDVDAEKDDVIEFFVQTAAYKRIAALEAPIVIGRKGAGKTAAYTYLKSLDNPDKGIFVTGLVFADYPWGAHNLMGNTEASQQERFVDSWRFLAAVEMASRIIRARQAHQLSKDQQAAFERVHEFLTENYGGLSPDHKEIYRPQRFRLSGKFAPKFTVLGTGGSLGEIDAQIVERQHLGNHLRDLAEALLSDVALLLRPNERHIILFDELDKSVELRDDDYRARLVGLLLAATDTRKWAARRGIDATAVVFLRTDIWRELDFSDQNKLPVEMLEWRMEQGSDHDLLALMEARIRVRLGLPGDLPKAWEHAFAGTGMRGGEHKLAFMEKRSFLRPRDVIRFSNLALEEAKKRVAVGKDTSPLITSGDVLKARAPYSTWLVKELNDEVAAHRSDWKKLLEPLRRIGRPHFELKSYEKEFEALSLDKQTTLTAPEALEFLYDFGIVSYKRVGGGGGGSAWIARYERGNEDVELDTRATSFKVHPGLKEYLHIKEH